MRSVFRLLALTIAGHVAASPIDAQQRLAGLVYDDLTREPLGGAWVAVLDSAGQELARTSTSTSGRFTLEFSSSSVVVVAGKTSYAQSAPFTVSSTLNEPEEALIGLRTLNRAAIEVALLEARAADTGTAHILGRVLDEQTGRPVVGAEVSLEGTADRVISGGEGAFSFDRVAPGPNVVRVRHLAYGEQSRGVALQAGSAYEVTIQLATEAIELEGIDVSVRSQTWAKRMDDVWARMNRGMGGHFMLPEELEMRSGQPLNSVLTSVPTLQIRSVVDQNGQADPFNQRIFLRGSCKAALWIDGVEVFNPGEDDGEGDPPPLQDFLRVSALDVALIEVFPGASSLPPEFARPGTKCAVSIWTKR